LLRKQRCQTGEVGVYRDQLLPRFVNVAMGGAELARIRARVAPAWAATSSRSGSAPVLSFVAAHWIPLDWSDPGMGW
jgi:hypothetical protein